MIPSSTAANGLDWEFYFSALNDAVMLWSRQLDQADYDEIATLDESALHLAACDRVKSEAAEESRHAESAIALDVLEGTGEELLTLTSIFPPPITFSAQPLPSCFGSISFSSESAAPTWASSAEKITHSFLIPKHGELFTSTSADAPLEAGVDAGDSFPSESPCKYATVEGKRKRRAAQQPANKTSAYSRIAQPPQQVIDGIVSESSQISENMIHSLDSRDQHNSQQMSVSGLGTATSLYHECQEEIFLNNREGLEHSLQGTRKHRNKSYSTHILWQKLLNNYPHQYEKELRREYMRLTQPVDGNQDTQEEKRQKKLARQRIYWAKLAREQPEKHKKILARQSEQRAAKKQKRT